MLTYPCSYEGTFGSGTPLFPGDDGALAVAQKLREFSLRHFHLGSRIHQILAGSPGGSGFPLLVGSAVHDSFRSSGSVPVRSLIAPGCSSPWRIVGSTTVILWARVMWPRANSVLLLIGTRFLEKWVPQAGWGPPDSTEPLKLVDLG